VDPVCVVAVQWRRFLIARLLKLLKLLIPKFHITRFHIPEFLITK